MTVPDLSSLPARMRYAAQILEEVKVRDKCPGGPLGPHTLRNLAAFWEAEDRAAAEHDTLIEELAREICEIDCVHYPNDDFSLIAQRLIKSGWRRVDPA